MPLAASSLARDLNPGQVRADISILIGASGAVTSYKGQGLKVTPVLATTGTYTLTTEKGYAALIGAKGSVRNATGTNVLFPVVTGAYASGVLTVETRLAAGTVTNPASGSYIDLELIFDEQGIVK